MAHAGAELLLAHCYALLVCRYDWRCRNKPLQDGLFSPARTFSITYQCVPNALITNKQFRVLPELMLYSSRQQQPQMHPSYQATTYTPYQRRLLKWEEVAKVSLVASTSTTPKAAMPYGEAHRGTLSFPVSPRAKTPAQYLPNPTCNAAGGLRGAG